jgi:hypothetical protein
MKQAKNFNIEGMLDYDSERHTIYETKLLDYFQNLRFLFFENINICKYFTFWLISLVDKVITF